MDFKLTEPLYRWINIAVLIISAPFFLFPSDKYILIVYFVTGWFLFSIVMKKISIKKNPLLWGICILVFQVFIACLLVENVFLSLNKVLSYLFSCFLFFSVIALLDSKRLLKLSINIYLIGGLFFSVLSVFAMSRIDKFSELNILKQKIPQLMLKLPGAESGFNANAVAGTVLLFLPLALVFVVSFFLDGRWKYENNGENSGIVFHFIYLAIMVFLLVFSQSRGSIIGMILSGWIIFIIFMRRKQKNIGLTIAFIQISIMIVLASYLSIIGHEKIQYVPLKGQASYVDRGNLWGYGIEMVEDSPFWGTGLNQLRYSPGMEYEMAHAHNHLIHTAAELGIPGLIAFLAILVGVGHMCMHILKYSDILWMKHAAIGLGWGQLAHFFFGINDSIPLGTKASVIWWISLALIVSMYNYTFSNNTGDNLLTKLSDFSHS